MPYILNIRMFTKQQNNFFKPFNDVTLTEYNNKSVISIASLLEATCCV